MRTIKIMLLAIGVLGCITVQIVTGVQQIALTDADAKWIGNKIFYNECSGKKEYLIDWNDGEDFISLGIGHFIWYPENKIGPCKTDRSRRSHSQDRKGAATQIIGGRNV